MILHYALVWMHLLSMAGLFGLLIACHVLTERSEAILRLLKIFFGLLFVTGFSLAYLLISTALSSGTAIPMGTYHILATKFVLLMGLGHMVMVGAKKNIKNWPAYSLIMIAIASFLGIFLRYYS